VLQYICLLAEHPLIGVERTYEGEWVAQQHESGRVVRQLIREILYLGEYRVIFLLYL
jgi:hypothetical protein